MTTSQTTNSFGVFSPDADLLSATLARNWWAVAIRGGLGVAFGIVALTLPVATILTFVLVFAAYALVGGLLALVSVLRATDESRPWGLLALEGLAGIVAGVAAVLWPSLSVTVFVLLVAAWALVSGVLMFAASFSLKLDHGRWWLTLGGVASFLYGLLLIAAPFLGALILTWWLGAYALVFGASLLLLSLRLRARKAG